MISELEPLVRPEQAAEFLGVSRRRVLELARAGQIPAVPLGEGSRKTWRFRLSQFSRVAQSFQQNNSAQRSFEQKTRSAMRNRLQLGSLRKESRKSGQVWVFRYLANRPSDGKRVEHNTVVGPVARFTSKAAAWQEVESLHLRDKINSPSLKLNTTFGDLARYFKDQELDPKRETSELARTTMATYRLILNRHLLIRWEDVDIRKIDHLSIRQWLESLPLQNPTRDKIRRVMSQVYKYAQENNLIPPEDRFNPLRLVRIKTVSRYRPIIVTPSQCLAILNQLEPLQLTLTVLVAATGLRISEALGLQWQDIDFEGQQIHIRRRYTCGDIDDPKTEASKAVVPLHSALAAYLLRWKQTTPWNKQGDWLFASERLQGKRPRVSGMLAQDYLRPAALKAGVQIAEGQRFGFHNLRHSLSTLLVTKLKEDPKTVQAILRHANIKTTLQIYTQSMSDDRLTAQGRVMDAIFQTTQVGQERVQ